MKKIMFYEIEGVDEFDVEVGDVLTETNFEDELRYLRGEGKKPEPSVIGTVTKLTKDTITVSDVRDDDEFEISAWEFGHHLMAGSMGFKRK